MKGINVLFYSMKQGLKNLKKNSLFTLASIGTISACLFLFGIFYFIISNFQYMLKTAETSVGITVFFDAGCEEEQIKAIGQDIRSKDGVKEVVYVSAEEAAGKSLKMTFLPVRQMIFQLHLGMIILLLIQHHMKYICRIFPSRRSLLIIYRL